MNTTKNIECNVKCEKRIDLEKAWLLSKSWKNAAIIWRTIEHFFTVGSFVASIIVIYVSAEYNNCKSVVIALSTLAAMLTVMEYACNPSKYMSNYRMVFEILNNALISNTDRNGNFSGGEQGWKEIGMAIERGEKYIGKTYDVSCENYLEEDRDEL